MLSIEGFVIDNPAYARDRTDAGGLKYIMPVVKDPESRLSHALLD